MPEMITLTIDGEAVETPVGTTVLAAALNAGICIPNLCWLPRVTPTGACRICLVEVERHGRMKMTASCTLEVQEGMVIHAHSEDVLRARRNIVELLLAEAPQSEVLQAIAERLGVDEARYPPRESDSVLCGRCVTACAEIAGTGAKGLIGRGNRRHIGLPFYHDKYCQKCGECSERCPMDIAPVAKKGKPGGVCGSELSKNEELPSICEDCTRLGVAEYVVGKLGVKTVELKWGQGAKCIGGEIKVGSLERALELQKRGYIVTPDPSNAANQAAFKAGAIKEFERHSRLGFIDQEGFMREVERLRSLGATRVTLKTGAYPMRELAMAIKWSSDAKIDLLTIDGSGGGTGMSPWRMMEEWGIPTFYLQCMTNELVGMLQKKGSYVPDIAMAGGFSTEDHIFKVLALGAPFTKAVCMGRALMIPGMVGKNFDEWIKTNKLPKEIKPFGSTREELFVCYEELKAKYGSEIDKMPLGAVAFYTFAQKLQVGLQQLMAGARRFNTTCISRDDLCALTEESAKISKIPYVMDAYRSQAMDIMN